MNIHTHSKEDTCDACWSEATIAATAAERERWLPLLAAVKEEMESNRGWCPVCSGHKTDHMDACPLKLLLEGADDDNVPE